MTLDHESAGVRVDGSANTVTRSGTEQFVVTWTVVSWSPGRCVDGRSCLQATSDRAADPRLRGRPCAHAVSRVTKANAIGGCQPSARSRATADSASGGTG